MNKIKFVEEKKFCHSCGGWGRMGCKPCSVCEGLGVVTIIVPAPDVKGKDEVVTR